MIDVEQCSVYIFQGVVAKPDADIAGIGVISAFVLSACLTFAAVLIAYIFGLVDGGLLRPADRLILRVPSRARDHPRLHRCLRKAILTLSDQQIVTGIAILGAGFQGLRTNAISVYHFQLVTYLAWMSSSVHLSALTLLRPYLFFHRGVMIWRLIGMFVLFIMLLVALVPTVSNDWDVVGYNITEAYFVDPDGKTPMGAPAICFWGRLYGDGINPDAIISFIVLFISYAWKMGGVFLVARQTFQSYCLNPISCAFERLLTTSARRCHKKPNLLDLFLFRLTLAHFVPISALIEIATSFSAALWLSILGLIYGIMQVVLPRAVIQFTTPGLAEAETAWSFGQLVPLILLIQPLGAISEHLWLRDQDDERYYDDLGITDPTISTSRTISEWQKARQSPTSLHNAAHSHGDIIHSASLARDRFAAYPAARDAVHVTYLRGGDLERACWDRGRGDHYLLL